MKNNFEKANIALGELRDSGRIQDFRRNKGVNPYSKIVSDSYPLICELISKGHTLTGIFRHLQDNEIFNESADNSSFFRAVKREQRRRGKSAFVREKTPPISARIVPSENNSHPEGIEYEQDGKKYVSLDGQVREIPKGYRFLRGRICPNMDDQRIESKQERLYNFDDYPEHIQEAIRESSRNGRVLEDAAKNKKLVEEWKASLEE